MAEIENDPVPPKACHAGRNFFISFLVGLALLTALCYAAASFYPKEGFQGILVPVEQKASRIDALEKRLDILEKRLDEAAALPAQAVGDSASLNEEIKKLKIQVENKDSSNQQTSQKFVGAAFAFWDLREAAKNGHSFAPQLAALRMASAGDVALLELATKLDPYAAAGTSTLAQLRESLIAEEKAVPLPAAETDSASWISRAKAILQPLISVRPLHDARFAVVEKALDSGDANAVLEAAKALSQEARAPFGAWQAKLEARIALDDALQALAAHFMMPSTPRSTP